MTVYNPSLSCGCNYNQDTPSLTLDGRLQEFSATKELVRQIPFFINKNLQNKKSWLFQRTLTSTSSSATFPLIHSTQFKYATGGTQPLNNVEGVDDINYLQPNFIYIGSDSPIKVTFAYVPAAATDKFKDPTSPGTNLSTQPYNVNMPIIVNGYYVRMEKKDNLKVAPQVTADMTTWTYSGLLGGSVGSWSDAGGRSDTGIIFPIFVEKSARIAKSKVVIYGAILV